MNLSYLADVPNECLDVTVNGGCKNVVKIVVRKVLGLAVLPFFLIRSSAQNFDVKINHRMRLMFFTLSHDFLFITCGTLCI